MESVLSASESANSTDAASTNASSVLSSFSVFNVRGLKPMTVPSKVPYVGDLLAEKNQLFMAVTETWLQNHKDAEVATDGYKFFRSDRKRRKKSARGRLSGGVGCYVKTDIAATMELMVDYSNGVIELLGLYSKSKNIFIAVIYRQPDDRIGGNRSTEKEFQVALNKLQSSFTRLPDPAPNIIFAATSIFEVHHGPMVYHQSLPPLKIKFYYNVSTISRTNIF